MSLGRSVPFVFLVVASSVLAGCLGGGNSAGDDADAKTPTVTDPGAAAPITPSDDVTTEQVKQGKKTVEKITSADVPVWSKGRFWTFEAAQRQPNASYANVTFTLAVVDDATDYVLATDNTQLAYDDATKSDLFFIGAFGKTDLAYVAQGAPYALLKFPLADGANWTAADPTGRTVSFRAAYTDDIRVGDVRYQGFAVSGTDSNGTLVYEFTYLPEAKWFGTFTQYDPDIPADPKHTISMRLTAFGPAFDGEVVKLDANWIWTKHYKNAVEGNKAEKIAIPDGLTKLFVYVHIDAGIGFWSDVRGYGNATLITPDNKVAASRWNAAFAPIASGTVCAAAAAHPYVAWCRGWAQNNTAFVPAQAGEWTLLYTVATIQGIDGKIGIMGITETAIAPGA